MGTKGDKLTDDATDAANQLVDDLQPLGDVTARKMFGGYGISEAGTMFALIDSAGTPHLKADNSTEPAFIEAGSTKHARMPYWSIPTDVLVDPDALLAWSQQALDIARTATKR